jgi:hypothetical protein
MSDQQVVVDGDKLTYEGVFSVTELYRLIFEWLPNGRFIEIDITPDKTITDYAKSKLKIRIEMGNIKDVVITTKEGGKQKLNQGKVTIIFTGILETDYENRWESKPVYMFIRGIYDKFIYKTLTGGFESTVKRDLEHLKNNIYGYLNLHQYKK